MAYTFQYVPTSGDLSGASFESQTAIAINELGTQTDETKRSTGQALATAQNAQTTANDALVTAQNADGSAGNARLAADQALAAAGSAQTQAAAAIEHANNAYDTAEIAETTAGSALAGAQTATETANNAQAEAATASQNAEQAVAVAQGALAAASIDNGLFTVDATLRDADEAYRGTEKSYLTSTDEDGPNVNFPDDLAFPAYFEVMMSDEGGAVMQRCWQDGGTQVFTRFASVNDSDPDNPVVTWTEWESALGDISKKLASSGVPIGFEALWPGATPPEGWLDQSKDLGLLPRATFPKLWEMAQASGNIITDASWQAQRGTQGSVGAFSSGDGSTTFRVPLRRKVYVRAADPDNGLDVGQYHDGSLIAGQNTNSPTGVLGGLVGTTGTLQQDAHWDSRGTVPTGKLYIANAAYQTMVDITTPSVFAVGRTRPVSIVRLPIIKAYDTIIKPADLDVAAFLSVIEQRPEVRALCTSDTTVYVRADGDDANDGLASAKAIKTLARLERVLSRLDGCGYSLTISIGPGTWDENLTLVGGGNVVGFSGVKITGAGYQSTIKRRDLNIWFLKVEIADVTFSGTGTDITGLGERLILARYCYLSLSGTVELGKAHSRLLLSGSFVSMAGILRITGNAFYGIDSRSDSYVQLGGSIVVSAAQTSVFAYCSGAKIINGGATITGTSTGQRYQIGDGGVINTQGGGANWFPGTVAGTASTGGQYY